MAGQLPTEQSRALSTPTEPCIVRCVGGQQLGFLAGRAVHWQANRTLLIADVHLGKTEALASSGVPAPDGLLTHDLARLTSLIEQTQAQRVIVLGDLLHAPVGLTKQLIDAVAQWRERHAGLTLQLVPGNHDRKLSSVSDAWKLEVLSAVHDEAGLRLTHEPPATSLLDASCPVLCGHVHPMALLKSRGDRLRLHAYLLTSAVDANGTHKLACVILPAFCTFASGVAVRHDGQTLAIAGNEVFEV